LWPWLPGNAPFGRDLINTCVMGLVVFVLGQRLQVFGNQLGTASNSSILMAVEPLLTSAAAAIFLREHIGPRRGVGFALSMAGVVLLNGPWRADFKWTGLGASLIFLSSFLCESAYSILGKPILTRAGPAKVLALSLAAGTALNLLIDGPATMVAARAMPPQAWLLVLGLALVCTSFGYSFWFIVIRESEINVAAFTIFAQPIFGVALATLWVGESLNWAQLWGSLAIIAGLVLGLSRQIKTTRQATRPD
jgi:drug/metabolite transporter (DMT)-like permease